MSSIHKFKQVIKSTKESNIIDKVKRITQGYKARAIPRKEPKAMTLFNDEMLFLAKHYAHSRIRAIAAIDEAMDSIDDKNTLAIAVDTRKKLSDMTDEIFNSLDVEDWAKKNGVDIVCARDDALGVVNEG